MANSDQSSPIDKPRSNDEELLCKLEALQMIKSESSSQNQTVINTTEMNIDDNDEGFKTPTSREHRITVDLSCPPPAPRKLPIKNNIIFKRRRTSPRIPLIQVSYEEITRLLFARHHPINDQNSIHSADHINDNNQVNNSNLTTIMSFR
ncbi:unnamed protein product [Amaranthus hypochondriacus]